MSVLDQVELLLPSAGYGTVVSLQARSLLEYAAAVGELRRRGLGVTERDVGVGPISTVLRYRQAVWQDGAITVLFSAPTDAEAVT